MNAYTSPEAADVSRRRDGRKLTTVGVVLGLIGLAGVVLSTLLKVVWLGILGGPIGFLSWVALIAGVACFVAGFNMIRSTHPVSRL